MEDMDEMGMRYEEDIMETIEIDFTPCYKKILNDIITLEYSDIKEKEWFSQIQSYIDDSYQFLLTVDNIDYTFSNINELFKDSPMIYLRSSKKLENINPEKSREYREIAQMAEHAIYKIYQFLKHTDDANDLMESFESL